jgi:polyhydroxyalkanoate depolymerase
MIYEMYQAQTDMMSPIRTAAGIANRLLTQPWTGIGENLFLRTAAAATELLASGGTTHVRPPFAIDSVMVGNREVAVREQVADATPFASLLHFAKQRVAGEAVPDQPKVLIVAPLSGHFATLLRGTARTMLADHDVYITDWHNARDVPMADGRFDFDDYVDHVMRFLRVLGPGSHVVAVCQPTVAVLVAASVMAANDDPAQPRSMTLMAGPIDTRLNPTKVNKLAKEHPIGWFERNLIGVVPLRYRGATRRVYPGFVQLSAFMSMNLDRHVRAYIDQFRNVMKGELLPAQAHRKFYDEYLAVMDLPAEFFLETVQKIFQDHDLPLGRLTWRGQKVDPGAIRRTFVFTVEGEQDDICAVGQTMAALDLCRGLRPSQKRHHLQTGAGHYGVFNGRRWTQEIYPMIREVIEFTDRTGRVRA